MLALAPKETVGKAWAAVTGDEVWIVGAGGDDLVVAIAGIDASQGDFVLGGEVVELDKVGDAGLEDEAGGAAGGELADDEDEVAFLDVDAGEAGAEFGRVVAGEGAAGGIVEFEGLEAGAEEVFFGIEPGFGEFGVDEDAELCGAGAFGADEAFGEGLD